MTLIKELCVRRSLHCINHICLQFLAYRDNANMMFSWYNFVVTILFTSLQLKQKAQLRLIGMS